MAVAIGGLQQAGIVGLSTLRDLERVFGPILDVVAGSPGKGAVFGLVGDGLDILQVAGVSFAQSDGDGL